MSGGCYFKKKFRSLFAELFAVSCEPAHVYADGSGSATCASLGHIQPRCFRMGDTSVFSADHDSGALAGDCCDACWVEEEGHWVCGHRDKKSIFLEADVEDSFALPNPRELCEGKRVVTCAGVLG